MTIYKEQLQQVINQKLPWKKLMGKTVLISGATGMIGKCLIDILMLRNKKYHEKIQIVALSRNNNSAKERLQKYWSDPLLNYQCCDVNEKICEIGDVDYIVHAASNTHPVQYATDPVGTILTNVMGTKNLLDYAVTHHVKRFVFLSSVEVYGENRGDVEKFNESYLGYLDCNTLRAGYPESKRLGETLCNAYYKTYGLDFVIPRLSRIYGPTVLLSDTKAISQFIKKAVHKENIVLKSEGNQKYSYTFVTDAVSGIIYAMLCGKSRQAYNIADAESDISLKDLAEVLAKIADVKVVFDKPENTEREGYSTATKAMLDAAMLEQIGWKPHVHIEEGLINTLQILQENLLKENIIIS